MRQNSLITLVSLLALFLGGCPSSEDTAQTTPSTPTPSVVKPTKRTPITEATPFATTPLMAGQPAKSTAVAGLIQTLPPEARVNQIRKNVGRSDPFAAIPTVPILVPPSPTAAGQIGNRAVPVIPPLPQTRGNAGAGAGSGTRTGSSGTRTGSGTGKNKPTTTRTATNNTSSPATRTSKLTTKPPLPLPPPGIGQLPPIATGPLSLPTLPEPTLAKGIEVTGVVQVGGVPSAIVKVPNEPARSVKEGERLSNGQVLVKRIEVNQGPSPVVILEQFGQEVARQVGDKPTGTPGEPVDPTAFLKKPMQVS